MQDCLTIVIVSDSTGETANTYLKAVTTQFPNLKSKIIRRPNIRNKDEVDEIIKGIPKDSLLVLTIADYDIARYLREIAIKNDMEVLDILDFGIAKIERMTGQKAVREPGLIRALSKDYFNMIEAIEFAIQYDDGKNPKGFLKSDIILLGVSRTSKTPTTMILSTKNYKVSNLPLVPESRLPQEIFEVDPKRIIGLIIDPDKLANIRESRTKELGLIGNSVYYKDQRIKAELSYAKEVFKDLDCKVIDVTNNTIEQTATEIESYYKSQFGDEK